MACYPEPSVTNSKAPTLTDDNFTVQAFYECLAGFSMAGNPRISCNKTLDVWDTPPSCTVINDNVYVYNNGDGGHEWWYYFLAAILTGLFFLLLALVIWCCCWAPRSYFYDCRCCCIRQRSRRLHDPNVHASTNGTKKEVFWVDTPDRSVTSKQTAREIQVARASRPAKDPTKDTKIWMPHTHSIRHINTSTK